MIQNADAILNIVLLIGLQLMAYLLFPTVCRCWHFFLFANREKIRFHLILQGGQMEFVLIISLPLLILIIIVAVVLCIICR